MTQKLTSCYLKHYPNSAEKPLGIILQSVHDEIIFALGE